MRTLTYNWVRLLLVLIALAAVFVAGCGGGGSTGTGSPPAAMALFDALWSDFDANYSFFELKGIDWNDSRSRYRSQLTAGSTDDQLFSVLSAMLLELQDGHVRLDTPLGISTYTGWFDQYPANFDESIVTATYLGATPMMSPQANLLFGQIDADIGYVRVGSLGGSGHGEDMNFILAVLGPIRALTVDLRNNGGGNDQNGEAIAARFTDTRRLYRRIRFREGPNPGDFGPFIDSYIAPADALSFQGLPARASRKRFTYVTGMSVTHVHSTDRREARQLSRGDKDAKGTTR